MADEVQAADSEALDPGVTVEVEPERKRPAISDADLEKMTSVNDDEISRANADAKKAVKSLRTAYQEQRRRAEQWSKDASTASNLAEQLYRENQQLRSNVQRSEAALINQALIRAEAQLEAARQRSRQAIAADDADQATEASEALARAVAEVDRLKLLKPAAGGESATGDTAASPAPAAPQQNATPRTRAWLADNPWFGRDQEMTEYAKRQDQHLAVDGITESTNPDLYWRTIDEKLRERFPEKFGGEARPAEGRAQARPVAVTGGTRSTSTAPAANGKRVVRLNESEVRIAKRLGVTLEAYAAQKMKEQDEEARRSA